MEYLVVLLGYILGAIPFAHLLVTLTRGVDVREIGSGNVGATNAMRAAGKGVGIAVLFLDALKGAIPTALGFYFSPKIAYLAGFMAILGHTFPIFLKFKGGKGVATSFGVMLVISPVAILGSLLVFILVVALTRYVSLGSVVATLSFPLWFYLYSAYRGIYSLQTMEWLFIFLIVCLIIFNHRSNIKRLIDGKERRLGE